MKVTIKKGILAAFLILISGCSTNELTSNANNSDDTETTTAESSGTAIYTLITETDPYTDWGQFPEATGTVESSAPHGPFAKVYINAIAAAALDDSPENLPDGSIIVKDSIDTEDEESQGTLTIMKKVEGFSHATHDWVWVMVSPSGEVQAEGNIDMCISCHAAARDNDYLFLHQLQ